MVKVGKNNKKITKISSEEIFCRYIFLIGYLIYVLSNSRNLQDIFLLEYKHIFFVCVGFFSLIYRTSESLKSALFILPITLIYLIGGLIPYAIMSLLFSLSIPVIWIGISSIIYRGSYRLILLMAIISLIPAIISYESLIENGLFDTTYGRPRMLLGYAHPKEASISFFLPLFLGMIAFEVSSGFLWISFFIFIWMVGSRNIALIFLFAWIFRWHSYSLKFFAFPILLTLCGILLFEYLPFEYLDQLSSLRLSHWINVLNNPILLNDPNFLSGDRFGSDNFFIEVISLTGFFGILLMVLWIIFFMYFLYNKSKTENWPLICFILLLFTASFDTGIVSTGNMIHVLLWSIILSPFFSKKYLFSSP